MQEIWVQFLGWEDPLELEMATPPVFLPGKVHGQRNLVDYSPRGLKGSDMTKQLSTIVYYVYIHSSVNEHLGCFHDLAIVNSAEGALGYMYLLKLEFSPDICPEVGLLDHVVALCLVIYGTSILFSIVAAQTYIPTNSLEEFSFLHTFADIYYL